MKREKFLHALTHGHHHGLQAAQNVEARLETGTSREEFERLRSEVAVFLESSLTPHFALEEEVLFPLFRKRAGVEDPALKRLETDHAALREVASAASSEALQAFADLLRRHIRFEEEEWFPRVEALLTAEEKEEAGRRLQRGANPSPKIPPAR